MQQWTEDSENDEYVVDEDPETKQQLEEAQTKNLAFLQV